jgi:alkylation response protein AidB-like acyl-CoA dehydrogenase
MDLSYGEAYEAFRSEVKAFLAENWPARGAEADLSLNEQVDRFREKAIDAGYLARAIPRKYGGSEQEADVLKAAVIREEFRKGRAPGDPIGLGVALLVPTLLEKGTEWQKEKFIGPTIRGHMRWCQGYSEPGAGSDLASVQTKAELAGDEWVINGQKIWTSGAHLADYCFGLVRTEPEASKHAGISYMLIDMKQPGVEVRPLKQMTGTAGFSEVFFTDAKTPKDWIVGKRGEGWIVSRTTLKHERSGLLNVEQASALLRPLVELARRTERNGRPAIEDPEIRQRLVQVEGYMRANEYSLVHRLSKAAKGQEVGRIQLMAKLIRTDIQQEAGKLAYDLLGDDALLAAGERRLNDPEDNAGWVAIYMGSLGGAIAAGSSNIQRNIIGERGLGLPRDQAAQRS